MFIFASPRACALFRDGLAGPAELRREIFQLGQAVTHRQHRLGVVDVNAGGESQRRNRRCVHVHETNGRMIGHQVAAALRTILALTELGPLERRDMLGSGRDPHSLRLPEAEGGHRCSGPRTARPAMAITHALGRSGDFDFDRSAKATSKMSHMIVSLKSRSNVIDAARSIAGRAPFVALKYS